MLEVVVSEADVAGLFVGVLELLVEVAVLDLDAFLVACDLVEGCPAVRATVGETARLEDALQAE